MRVPGGFVAATIATALAWSSVAGASPEDIYGWGARSAAMGGTGTAWASSSDAAYVNPALLSRVHQNELVIGFSGATYNLHARRPAGSPGARSRWCRRRATSSASPSPSRSAAS